MTSQAGWEVSACSLGRGAHQITLPEPAAQTRALYSHRLGLRLDVLPDLGTGSRQQPFAYLFVDGEATVQARQAPPGRHVPGLTF